MTNPYGSVLERLESPRETEARLLHRISCDLETADTKGSLGDLAQAVIQNRRIWTIFAVDLGNEGNGLPGALRSSLLSIAGAVDRTCSAVLAGDKRAVRDLVEINRNIASALC